MKRVVLLICILNLFRLIYGVNVSDVYKRIFKNLVITPKCSQQVEEFLSNFSADTNSWALKMLDASSKIPSGILSLNFGDLGHFQQCLDIKGSSKSGQIFGKYCLGSVLPFIDARIGTHINSTILPIWLTWALCVPDRCTAADVNQIANMFIKEYIEIGAMSVTFSDVFCQTEKGTHRQLTLAAMGTIMLLLSLVFAALFATFYDLWTGDSCPELIRAFSIPSNASKIYQIAFCTKENVSCLNGLRALSAICVVLGHQYLFIMTGHLLVNWTSVSTWLNTRSSMFLINGNFTMETFLTIGGTMMALSFLKARYHTRPRSVFYHVSHRYLRLVPSLIVVTLVHVTLLQHMGTGPRWPFIENIVQKHCEGYYGRMQFSFIQNYLHGLAHMCLGHTWYLNVDMQLYLFLHLALFYLWKYQKLFFKFLYACIVLSMASSFYIAWKYKIAAIGTNIYGNVIDFILKYQFNTHTHASSWLFGFLLGHFLFQRQLKNNPVKLNKYLVIITWFLCLLTLYTCLTFGFDTLRGPEYNRWGNVLHITFARPIWSIAIAWIILACSSNYGGFINRLLSHPVFSLMNVFSYGVYLVHESFMIVVAGSRKMPEYFSHSSVFLYFLGAMFVSSGVAVLLVFLVDAPFAGVVALMRRGRKRKEN